MAIVRWDSGRDLDALQGDMNRLFDTFFGRRDTVGATAARRWVPPMDLVETEDQLVLRADLPGMRREDIDIEIKDNVLTISGERKAEHEQKGEGFHRIERSSGRFSRSLGLPRGLDASTVNAGFENGVLEVRLPKPAERKPTKIEIATEARGRDSGADAPLVEAGENSAEHSVGRETVGAAT